MRRRGDRSLIQTRGASSARPRPQREQGLGRGWVGKGERGLPGGALGCEYTRPQAPQRAQLPTLPPRSHAPRTTATPLAEQNPRRGGWRRSPAPPIPPATCTELSSAPPAWWEVACWCCCCCGCLWSPRTLALLLRMLLLARLGEAAARSWVEAAPLELTPMLALPAPPAPPPPPLPPARREAGSRAPPLISAREAAPRLLRVLEVQRNMGGRGGGALIKDFKGSRGARGCGVCGSGWVGCVLVDYRPHAIG